MNAVWIFAGIPEIDQIVYIFLGTPMFLGGAIGFIMDNLLPGDFSISLIISIVQNGWLFIFTNYFVKDALAAEIPIFKVTANGKSCDNIMVK